jgi:uncharacterized peroxidase-related enzyme
MTQRIEGYEPGGGCDEADEALAGIATMFGGKVPNYHKVLANSPATITAFKGLRMEMQKTTISAAEREIVAIEVSRRNACEYCMAAHTKFARRLKVGPEDLAALVDGRPMSDPRHALIQRAAQQLWNHRGGLPDAILAEFRDQGLSDGELIEVIGVIAWYALSTMTNNLARTEIDPFFLD